MDNLIQKLRKARQIRTIRGAGVGTMALAVLIVTVVLMQLPAFTQQKPTYCGMPEHQHTEACYEDALVCTAQESSAHTHGRDCYQHMPTCGFEEHTHNEQCLSNPNADVETATDWEQSIPNVSGLAPSEALVAIARSQLGYCESARNYEVKEDATHAGYTRYGAAAGEPYVSWNVPFATFCLTYAGIGEDVLPRGPDSRRQVAPETQTNAGTESQVLEEQQPSPQSPLVAQPQPQAEESQHPSPQSPSGNQTQSEAGTRLETNASLQADVKEQAGAKSALDAASWIDALRAAGMYEDHATSAYVPLPGDLVFFMSDDGRVLAGITTLMDANKNEVWFIVGGLTNEVCVRSLAWTDRDLLGFGRLDSRLRPAEEVAAQPRLEDDETADDTVAVRNDPSTAASDSADVTALASATTPASPGATSHRLTATVAGIQFTAEAQLPTSASYELKATPVAATPEQIAQVEQAQSEALPDGIRKTAHVHPEALLCVDLAIVDENGDEVEPEVAASVTAQGAQATAAEDPVVTHFVAGAAESLAATPTSDGFAFHTPSFSTFAIAFTVDFTYEGYEYHLPGERQMLLSSLFAALHIPAHAADATRVEFSDPALLSVAKQETDWLLTSLKPFDSSETLTVSMANGDVYVIAVTDAKSFNFHYNVISDDAGVVYERSTNYGAEIQVAVQGKDSDASGAAAGTVRPRSSTEPTNAKLSATSGFYFIDWVRDGTVPFSTATDITPAVGQNGVENRATTFTARFAPVGQYLVTFARDVALADDGQQYGTISQGMALSYSYLKSDGTTDEVWYGFSGYGFRPTATPYDYGKFDGWYNVATGELVCATAEFVAPADLSEHIAVQARFAPAELCTVTYRAFFTSGGNVSEGGGTLTPDADTSISSTSVQEWCYENHRPGGAQATANAGYSFVGWRKSYDGALNANKSPVFSRDAHLVGSSLDSATQDVTYWAEFIRDKGTASRALFLVSPDGTGRINTKSNGTGNDFTGQETSLSVAQGTNFVRLGTTFYAVPAQGYRFDHWEFNGEWLSASSSIKNIDKPAAPTAIQELKAVFVPICNITYDTGVIQQVGNNAPEFQHWQDVPWCSSAVTIEGKGAPTDDKLTETVDYGAEVTLPDLTHNSPDGSQTIRVSQTNNGYNLLTHTFKGWRIPGTSYVYPPGTTFNAYGSYTFEAVWDAYLPGKTGYYGTGPQVYRHNTNTCGFFVRLFDGTYDIGNTNTYTDCLFTSRIFLSGESDFATNGSTNGMRFDFFGNSAETQRDRIDAIDLALRAYARASHIPYSEAYSGQSNGAQFPGSVIAFEQPFPSDEFIFGRIRQWNLSVPQSRKIQINGQKIPQDQLTPDYFDLRWYVLKDQENSWHVDGMLIPKYAKLVVRKRFDGAQAAIDAVKRGNFYIGVDTSKDDVGSSNEEFKLRLADATVENGEYVWRLDRLQPLTTYWVGEHSYTADAKTYTTTKNISIHNTPQSSRESTSYRIQVDKVFSYPDYASWDEVQTVCLANYYTQKREITLVKQDATTGNPLAGVTFDTTIYATQDGREVPIAQALTTDASGMISLKLDNPYTYEGGTAQLPAGDYRITFAEREREGYQPLPGPITGTLHLRDTEQSTLSLNEGSSFEGLAVVGQSDGTSQNILYVRNEPYAKSVNVRKRWTNNASTPVTMQLLRNGVPVTDASVEQPSVQLDASNWWSHTWSDLPGYIDGHEAIYTVREEWIGEPGGNESVHYNGGADADGYADFIVSQSQFAASLGGNEAIAVYVENTPDSGSVVFAKVDDAQRAVTGAEFTVYVDEACRIPISVANFTTGTSKQRPAVFSSDANGMVAIEGLNPGTYYLRETKAPSGYSLGDGRTYQLGISAHNSTITYASGGQQVGLTQVTNPVYRRRVRLRKIQAGNDDVVLEGALFSLHAAQADGTMAVAPMAGYERLTSDADGYAEVGELRAGMYYLVEEQAPAGYKKLETPVRITVPGDDATTITAIKVDGNTGVRVEGGSVVVVPNTIGDELPESGGAGTTGFYVAGGALMALCAVLAFGHRLVFGAGRGGDAA